MNPEIYGLDPEKALAALGNRLRWQIFRLLSAGTPMHAAQVARHFGREFDGISKHLRILRSAGLLRSRRAADRRVEQYFVPEEFRLTPGQVELGFCLLRVAEARPGWGDDRRVPSRSNPADENDEPVRGFGEMLVNSATVGSGGNKN